MNEAYQRAFHDRLTRVKREREYVATALINAPMFITMLEEGIHEREESGVIVYRQEDGRTFELSVREIDAPDTPWNR